MTLYRLRDTAVAYDGVPVLRIGALDFTAGALAAIAGPNGAGKSTLVGVMAGLRSGYTGSCRFEDKEIRDWPRRAFARRISVVPQNVNIEFPFTVEQVVLMGRTPYCDGLFESPLDHAAAARAIAITDCQPFRARDFRSLSGGERQRVVLAAALAQEPSVLLLDEPTTFLDPEHQLALFRILRGLARDGVLVIAVTHDLNLAAAFADRLILLKQGTVRADGPPAAVIAPAIMREVFAVEPHILQGPAGRPWIVYGE